MLRRIREMQATPDGAAFPLGRMLCAGLLVATAIYAIETLVVPQGRLDTLFDSLVYNGLLVAASLVCLGRGLLVRAERLPWLLLGTALALWTTGDLYYYFFLSGAAEVPIPSVADPFYLAFYPVSYVALALLLRKRMRGFRGNLWLDGVIASLAVAALGAAVVFDEVLSTTDGSALVVATNLAYPLADLLLLSLVVAMFGLTGWRFDATWALVALGFAVFAIADSIYLYETAAGTYVEGGPLDVGWPAALVLIACSAWQPTRKLEDVRDESWAALTVPTVFAGTGLIVLVYDHFIRINTVAVALSAATIAAVIVRAVLTFRERVSLLAASREEALTDALTGLGNRRRFVADAERALARVRSDRPRGLRPGRLQGVQRLVRPRCGRHVAEPGRRPPRRGDSCVRNRVPARRRRVLRPGLDRARRARKRGRTSRRRADRGRGRLRGQLLLRRSADARGGVRAHGRAARRRRPHVPPQAAEPPERHPADRRRAAERARRTRLAARAPPRGRGRPGRGGQPQAERACAAAADDPPGGRAARRRQARDPRGDPRQARRR